MSAPPVLRRLWPLLLLAGCAHTPSAAPPPAGVSYEKPAEGKGGVASRAVAADEGAWGRWRTALNRKPFRVEEEKKGEWFEVIYRGDPEPYVDCGRIETRVKSTRGIQTQSHPGAKRALAYVVSGPRGLYEVERTLELTARVRLAVVDGKATARGRYTLVRSLHVRASGELQRDTKTDTIRFDSSRVGSFPAGGRDGTVCRATGRLEEQLLSSLR